MMRLRTSATNQTNDPEQPSSSFDKTPSTTSTAEPPPPPRSKRKPKRTWKLNHPTLLLFMLLAMLFAGAIFGVRMLHTRVVLPTKPTADHAPVAKLSSRHNDNVGVVDPKQPIPRNPQSSSPNSVRQQSSSNHPLPQWISDYTTFHQQTRAKYPGSKLFTDPTAPKILMRVCLGLCGGLNDRLGQIPYDFYLANQTQRILLYYWVKPWALEYFLEPNQIDWSVPEYGVDGFHPKTRENIRNNFNHVKKYPSFPLREARDTSPNPNLEATLENAIRKVTTGTMKDERVIALKLLGHLRERELEDRLRSLGETDMIHKTPTFGTIWNLMFKPSPPVQAQVDQALTQMNIGQRYTAVHCRVRHPKGRKYGKGIKGQFAEYPADKTGLPFTGDDKAFAVKVATHAVQCARTLSKNDADEPVYFYSDSSELVQFMVRDLKNATSSSVDNNDPIDSAAKDAVAPMHLVARDVSLMNVHIDKQKGRDVHEYYGTFVDLLIGMGARCVTYGVGYYARLAAKISGIQCKLQHRTEEWGATAELEDPMCTTPDFYRK